MYPMMTSFDPTRKAVGSPNRAVWYIEAARFAASGGGGSSRASGSDGSGGGGGGCAELGGVSCQRHKHDTIGTTLAFSDSACPSNLVAHALLHAQNPIVNFDRAVVLDDVDPLSFLMSWRNDHDPFDFGVGSVADGTFGGRKPNFEQLLLFRSHRLMQVEAVSIAIGMSYSSSASGRQRINLIARTVTNKARVKVAERTNSTVERIRALAKNGMLSLHNKQKEVIDEERKNCHRMIAAILDSATRTLKEMSNSGCSVGSGSGCSGGAGDYGSTSGFGNTSANNCFSAAAVEPWLGSEPGNNRLAFFPSTLEPSPFSESRQLTTNPAWEGFANTSCGAMAHHLPPIIPPIVTPGPPQQQPTMSSPGSMVGRSSGSALIKMRDCLSVPRIFEEAPLLYKQHNTVIAYTPLLASKKSPMVTKMGAKTLVGLRSAHSSRKGSRHRLTPQAKEILEDWMAKHWLNPYPTGEEKFCLAQACKMTVSQVNNWMVNVRVRRRRTTKIGMATPTGPKHIADTGFLPKAVEANMSQGMAAAEAEDLLAG